MVRCGWKCVLRSQLQTILSSLDLLECKNCLKHSFWQLKQFMLTCAFSCPSWHHCIWSLFSFIHSWAHCQPLSLLYLITCSVPCILSYVHNFQALSVRRSFSCSCRLKWRWKVTRLTFDHFPWVMFCSKLILKPLTCSAVHSTEAPVDLVSLSPVLTERVFLYPNYKCPIWPFNTSALFWLLFIEQYITTNCA